MTIYYTGEKSFARWKEKLLDWRATMERFVSCDMLGPERENLWIAKCHKTFTPVIDQGNISPYDISRVSIRLREIGISSTRGYCFNQHQNDLRVIYILAARRFLSPKWALTLYNFKIIFPYNFFSPSTPIKDRNRISPYNINWISRGQVTRMKKNINEGEHKLIQY